MSQTLMVKSPEEDAKTFSAEGWKRTWPTLLHAVRERSPVMRKRHWSLPSVSHQSLHWCNILGVLIVLRVQSKVIWDLPDEDLYCVSTAPKFPQPANCLTLPSSEADAISESLKGFLSPSQLLCPKRIKTLQILSAHTSRYPTLSPYAP